MGWKDNSLWPPQALDTHRAAHQFIILHVQRDWLVVVYCDRLCWLSGCGWQQVPRYVQFANYRNNAQTVWHIWVGKYCLNTTFISFFKGKLHKYEFINALPFNYSCKIQLGELAYKYLRRKPQEAEIQKWKALDKHGVNRTSWVRNDLLLQTKVMAMKIMNNSE